MKVNKNDTVVFRFRVEGPEAASQLLGKLFATHLSQEPYSGLVVTASARTDVFAEQREEQELLERALEYIFKQDDPEAYAIRDLAGEKV